MMEINRLRSSLETKFAKSFGNLTKYEAGKLEYTKVHNYIPDWKVNDTTYLETKGRFTSADRSKMEAVLKQHPNITIAMVFQKPHMTLSKSSSTSYAVWCAKRNIPWFDINDTKGIGDFIMKHKGK